MLIISKPKKCILGFNYARLKDHNWVLQDIEMKPFVCQRCLLYRKRVFLCDQHKMKNNSFALRTTRRPTDIVMTFIKKRPSKNCPPLLAYFVGWLVGATLEKNCLSEETKIMIVADVKNWLFPAIFSIQLTLNVEYYFCSRWLDSNRGPLEPLRPKFSKNCPRTLKFSQSSKITPNLVTLQVVYVTAFERAHKCIIWSTPVRSQVEAKVFSVEKRMIERTEQKNKALRGSKEEKIKYNLRLKSHLMDLLISAIIIARLNMPLMNLS